MITIGTSSNSPTETACFYSEYLGRFVSVALSGDVVFQVALGAGSFNARTTAAAARALESYLRGENVDLGTFQVNLGNRSAFERAVLQSVRGIPRGRYGDLLRIGSTIREAESRASGRQCAAPQPGSAICALPSSRSCIRPWGLFLGR